jgi:hypothetical protein
MIASEIRYQGRVYHMTLPTIARLLRRGLRPIDYTMLALTADAHRMTVAQLCAAALEVEEVQP